MNTKIRTLAIIIGALVAIFVVTLVAYVQVNKIVYANRVTNYLIEEKKYSREEIASVKGVWGIKLPPFYSVVIFKDEPDVEYVYFAHNEVLQFSHRSIQEGRENGITESELKHYVPLE
ncbi:DUF3139 domain-containing protein [Paenibacillus sp. GCM10012306]|uniref:DUF3139 domain-containing protein n=1 Tax=Paenibacillus sp. GCM10012306 TaxID=3317342 RepID=UPI00361E34FF